jgi:membrane protein DedA with SNARE-associated domain
MLHEWMKIWFTWVENWGYWGVFILMAMESSIIPVPSEVVLPPAAFWAAQGRMEFWGVVAAGTVGSYVGSVISYFAAQWVGLPVLKRYGKYLLISEQKVELAAKWVEQYGVVGIFIARLLPVVRHLISMPAGILKMPFWRFSLVTLIGAGLWCTVLSWFGQKILGNQPELLQSPEMMVKAIRSNLLWFVIAVVGFCALYGVVAWFKAKNKLKNDKNTAGSALA